MIFYSIFALVSLFFVFLWATFFFFYSPRKTTSPKILFISFILGILTACLAFIFETIFSSFSKIDAIFFRYLFPNQNNVSLYAYLFVFIFLMAAIEEIIKFVFLRQYLKINAVNQIVDGMKIGIWLGLGFVFIENVFYFLNFYFQITKIQSLLSVIVLRGIFSTLAHALYGAIMGYYLSLAKFNKIYQSYFLQRGYLINIFIRTERTFIYYQRKRYRKDSLSC